MHQHALIMHIKGNGYYPSGINFVRSSPGSSTARQSGVAASDATCRYSGSLSQSSMARRWAESEDRSGRLAAALDCQRING